MVAKLNSDIEKLQQQLAVSLHGGCHEKKEDVNPLQSIIDDLKAKNLELEA